ncbi:MAG TPA: GxxExxY protein [Vicinamibacterales bacterium]|nr:GxxExxY protein [Vicinamibacterales bacterium]
MTTSPHDRDPRTHEIISAACDVHTEVGAGSYGEGVCRDALAVEFQLRKIPFSTEVSYPVFRRN